MSTVIDNLKAVGINQQTIAERLGLSTATISKWNKKGDIPFKWVAKIQAVFKTELERTTDLSVLISDPQQKEQWKMFIAQEIESELGSVAEHIATSDAGVFSPRCLQDRMGMTAIADLSDERSDDLVLSQLTADSQTAGFSVPLLLKAQLDDYENISEIRPDPQLYFFRKVLNRYIVVRYWLDIFVLSSPENRRLQHAADKLKQAAMKIAAFSLIRQHANADENLHKLFQTGKGNLLRYLETTSPAVAILTRMFVAELSQARLHYLYSNPLALTELDFDSIEADLRHYYAPVAGSQTTKYQFVSLEKRIMIEKLDEIIMLLTELSPKPNAF